MATSAGELASAPAVPEQDAVEGESTERDERISSRQRNTPRRTGIRGDTALHAAATNGHVGVIQVLVQAGCNIDSSANSDSFTPLMRAAEHKQLDAARELLESGASLTQKDRWGHVPLHWALVHSPEIADLMLAKGAKRCPWRCA